jgi:2'-5' RNA ligase
MPRLFIAVDLTAETKDALQRAQAPLQAAHLRVRWSHPEMMHLTLAFLGETDERHIARIEQSLGESVIGTHPFLLTLGSLGAFPSLARPKVIWCGIEGATDALGHLQDAIAAAVHAVVPRTGTHPYTPHLTIGRVRQDANSAERRLVGSAIARAPAIARNSWRIDHVVLYESVPASGGVRHVKRMAAPLCGASASP